MPTGAFRLVVISAVLSAVLAGLAGDGRAQSSGAPAGAQPASGEPAAGQGSASSAGPSQASQDAARNAAQDAGQNAGQNAGGESDESGEGPEEDQAPVPAGMHLSTYGSRLCARVDRQGAIDSGAGVLQLIDPDSGKPFAIEGLGYGRGLKLWAGGKLDLPEVDARLRLLAVPLDHAGDHRVRTVLHVQLLNHGKDLVMVRIGARLSAGGGDPLSRPVDALEFVPGTSFGHEDGFITRDGSAILAWEGPDPQVSLPGPPATPDAPAAVLTWELPVQPNTAHYLDLTLAGAAHQPEADEAGWRQALAALSYVDYEEQLSWQTDFQGTYTVFSSAMPQLDRALVGCVHFLRSLGEANREVVWLTDRPYGFPPTDAAAPAEIVGLFYEWGLGSFAEAYLHEAVRTAAAAGQQLSPDRRVALVAGLAGAVRLAQHDEALVKDLAGVIRALIVDEAAVEPWLDPQVVRDDLAALLMRADPEGGAEAASRLPALHWSPGGEGPVAAEMLAARQALSTGDREEFWEHFERLLEGTSRNGLGSMQPGGDLDGRFAIGFMALSRAMLLDDHGPDLRVMPGVNAAMLPRRELLDVPFLPSVFGMTAAKVFHFGGSGISTEVRLRQELEPNVIYVWTPEGIPVGRVTDSVGGIARAMPDGSYSAAIDPFLAGGLSFTVKIVEDQPAER